MQDLGIDLLMNPKKVSPGSVASMSLSHRSSTLSEGALSELAGGRQGKGGHHRAASVASSRSRAHSQSQSQSRSSGSSKHGRDRDRDRGHNRGRDRGHRRRQHSESRSRASSDDASDSVSESSYATSHTSSSGTYSSFSDGSSSSSGSGGSRSYGEPKRMTQEEIINQKRELLYQFDRLEKKGVPLPKKFTLASGLDEMKAEFERLKRERETDVSVKFQKRMLMTFVTGLEFMNNRFDPFAINLDGWSESVNESLLDFDDIFADLHEKYKGKANMPPELRLMFALGGSAFMFHLKKTMLNSQLPGLEQMMQAQAGHQGHAPAAPRGGGGGGLGGLSGLMGGLGGLGGIGSMLGGLGGLFGGGAPAAPMPSPNAPRQPMRGPGNVEDILRELQEQQDMQQSQADQRVEMLSTISESDISDIPDDVSVNNVLQTKRRAAAAGRRTLNI